MDELAAVFGIDQAAVVDSHWVDNGPGWVALLLSSADEVLAVRPGFVDRSVGLVGPYPSDGPAAFEVRGFFPKDGAMVEDPVTGSLNASLAQWLLSSGRATAPYVASQGTALGRSGSGLHRGARGLRLGRRDGGHLHRGVGRALAPYRLAAPERGTTKAWVPSRSLQVSR